MRHALPLELGSTLYKPFVRSRACLDRFGIPSGSLDPMKVLAVLTLIVQVKKFAPPGSQ